MKFKILIPLLLLVAVASCKKKEEPAVTPAPLSKYQFSFLLNGEEYLLRSDEFKYLPIQTNELGAYFSANSKSFAPSTSYPTLGLRYSWPVGHKVTEADVLGLGMKNLTFNDTSVRPQIEFRKTASSLEMWYSVDTGSGFHSIKLNSVQFLKQDTVAGAALRCYVISGTCSSVLQYDTRYSAFTNGTFDMIVAMHE